MKENKLVPMPGIEQLTELKEKYGDREEKLYHVIHVYEVGNYETDKKIVASVKAHTAKEAGEKAQSIINASDEYKNGDYELYEVKFVGSFGKYEE